MSCVFWVFWVALQSPLHPELPSNALLHHDLTPSYINVKMTPNVAFCHPWVQTNPLVRSFLRLLEVISISPLRYGQTVSSPLKFRISNFTISGFTISKFMISGFTISVFRISGSTISGSTISRMHWFYSTIVSYLITAMTLILFLDRCFCGKLSPIYIVRHTKHLQSTITWTKQLYQTPW